MKWEYKPHQIEKAKEAYSVLKKLGYVYIAGEPRSGKTPTTIYLIENLSKVEKVLVIAPKKAFDGWHKAIKALDAKKNYTIINPESLHKIKDKYQLIVVDESHLFGRVGKPTNRYKELRRIAKDTPHIHLSGTPLVETLAGVYYQMHLPRWSPFMCPNFYKFFDKYGITEVQYIAGRAIKVYKKTKEELLDLIDTFTVKMTQKDAGMEVLVSDKVHYIKLSLLQARIYNTIVKDKYDVVYASPCCNTISEADKAIHGTCKTCGIYGPLLPYELVADSTMKERVLLHQIEGGTIKVLDDDGNEKIIRFAEIDIPKLKWLKDIDNTKTIGIMSHFRGEQTMLKEVLPDNYEVYSSNAHSAGVDLSHLDRFIIYSCDYSGSNHIQRRERIANMEGSNTLIVEFLLSPKAISDQVYKAISNKQDFNNSLYEAITVEGYKDD